MENQEGTKSIRKIRRNGSKMRCFTTHSHTSITCKAIAGKKSAVCATGGTGRGAVSPSVGPPLPVRNVPGWRAYGLLFPIVRMPGVPAAEFTPAEIQVNKRIPLWECPVGLLSDNCLQFCSKLSYARCPADDATS